MKSAMYDDYKGSANQIHELIAKTFLKHLDPAKVEHSLARSKGHHKHDNALGPIYINAHALVRDARR